MLRENIFDIEVKSEGVFPLPEQALYEINSITWYDNFSNHHITVIVDPAHAGQVKKSGNWDIYYVANEKTLLIFSIKLVKYYNPDIIYGYYSKKFDFPYFFIRMINLEMKHILNGLSPLNYVNAKDFSISGRHVSDLIVLDKKLKKRSSYTLENVAKEENLPILKSEKHEDLELIYKQDKDRFAFYNKSDVEILVELNKKIKHITFFESIRNFAGLNDFNDSLFNSTIIDMVCLRKAYEKGIILPSKPEYVKVESDEEDEETLGGGLVRVPKPGIHFNIIVLDMAKFYPIIILLLNLSQEMIIASGLTKEQTEKYRGNFDYIIVEYEEGKYAILNAKEKGFIPEIVQEFIAQRQIVEKDLKNLTPGTIEHTELSRKRDVVKFALNAVFGVNGSEKFRLYSAIISNCVTFSGRKMISWTADRLIQLLYKVIYGDTDSIHLELFKEVLLDDVIKKGKELSEMLSKEYVELVEKEFNVKCKDISFDIDFEKSFRSIIYIKSDKGVPIKKRYAAACQYEKGKKVDYLYVRGFDTRRSDASKYTKTLQEQIFKLILWDHPKEEIIKYVQSMIEGFKVASLDDIAIPKGIVKKIEEYGKIKKDGNKGSIPAQINGAIYSNTHLKTNFGAGSNIKYIYIKKMPKEYPPTPVISFEDVNKLPEGIIIDYDKMIDMNIRKKVERILQAAGINWNDIEGQKSLFEF